MYFLILIKITVPWLYLILGYMDTFCKDQLNCNCDKLAKYTKSAQNNQQAVMHSCSFTSLKSQVKCHDVVLVLVNVDLRGRDCSTVDWCLNCHSILEPDKCCETEKGD